MAGFLNRFEVRPVTVWAAAVVFGLLFAGSAAAGDESMRVAAAAQDGADAFVAGEKLDDTSLRGISGFGADPTSGTGAAAASELSVILFDELGRPKGGKPPVQNTNNSTISSEISGQFGR